MKVKIKYLIIALYFGSSNFQAQSVVFNLSGKFPSVKILKIQGETTTFIDSLYSQNGSFFIEPAKYNLEIGFYRFYIDKNKWFNFIYDGEDVKLNADYHNLSKSLKVVKSESNKLYQQIVKLNSQYKTKSELLNLILARFPSDDHYYLQSQKRLRQLQAEYQKFIDLISQADPDAFIARYIRSSQLSIIPESVPIEKHLDYLKLHSLDHVDFDDEELINSDCFTNKSIEYLMYYRNPQLPKQLLEKEFMVAVDTLLTKAKVNALVYQHITEYLIKGFKDFGFDEVIDYILENYVVADDICLNEELENSIQRRIDQSRNLSIGIQVPDFSMQDVDNKPFRLSELKSDKTLLIFYASWCTHCQEVVPEINQLYNESKTRKFEIVAISLDEIREEWEQFVNEHQLNGVNVSDLKGWYGDTAEKYSIYATPTMFLLDGNKKIIAKPRNLDELKTHL